MVNDLEQPSCTQACRTRVQRQQGRLRSRNATRPWQKYKRVHLEFHSPVSVKVIPDQPFSGSEARCLTEDPAEDSLGAATQRTLKIRQEL